MVGFHASRVISFYTFFCAFAYLKPLLYFSTFPLVPKIYTKIVVFCKSHLFFDLTYTHTRSFFYRTRIKYTHTHIHTYNKERISTHKFVSNISPLNHTHHISHLWMEVISSSLFLWVFFILRRRSIEVLQSIYLHGLYGTLYASTSVFTLLRSSLAMYDKHSAIFVLWFLFLHLSSSPPCRAACLNITSEDMSRSYSRFKSKRKKNDKEKEEEEEDDELELFYIPSKKLIHIQRHEKTSTSPYKFVWSRKLTSQVCVTKSLSSPRTLVRRRLEIYPCIHTVVCTFLLTLTCVLTLSLSIYIYLSSGSLLFHNQLTLFTGISLEVQRDQHLTASFFSHYPKRNQFLLGNRIVQKPHFKTYNGSTKFS